MWQNIEIIGPIRQLERWRYWRLKEQKRRVITWRCVIYVYKKKNRRRSRIEWYKKERETYLYSTLRRGNKKKKNKQKLLRGAARWSCFERRTSSGERWLPLCKWVRTSQTKNKERSWSKGGGGGVRGPFDVHTFTSIHGALALDRRRPGIEEKKDTKGIENQWLMYGRMQKREKKKKKRKWGGLGARQDRWDIFDWGQREGEKNHSFLCWPRPPSLLFPSTNTKQLGARLLLLYHHVWYLPIINEWL